jgi:hypothetical protein
MAGHKAFLKGAKTFRKQKRQALESVHLYQKSYKQSKVAQQLAGIDYDTRIQQATIHTALLTFVALLGTCQSTCQHVAHPSTLL